MASIFDISIMGTSLCGEYNSRNWPLMLERHLQIGKREKVKVHRLGKDSMCSNWGLANIGQHIILKPRVFIVEFINDAYIGYQDTPPENMNLAKSLANFNAIIDAMQSGSSATTIFLMKLVRPTAAAKASTFPTLDAYDAQLDQIAVNRGVGMIDTRAAWGDPALHPEEFPPTDGVHCFLEGHLRVTIPTVAAAVSPLIK